MPHVPNRNPEPLRLRPYELPKQKYKLWYDVGKSLSPVAQAVVMVALADSQHRVCTKELLPGEVTRIKELAKDQGVLLQFL